MSADAEALHALAGRIDGITELLKSASPGSHATINHQFGHSGVGTILAGVCALACLSMLVMLILTVVRIDGQNVLLHQELSDVKKEFQLQDAYIRQHEARIGRLESPKEKTK